ncbi:Cysteine/Histidine-rich C1 domain family protein [Arabidopsis thaliana]|nr:Cysteine/Histidine-rich C1 domain family protein [Arabidopsis thaliana]AEE31815.1 Cysteine/Histidine-rich C1 domain family protein [Arabidopsis thaliana]|eukprot:NP_174794.1 Cysteine/Histidine-rich C1 domain family protein [Arabidopsis thaliana]
MGFEDGPRCLMSHPAHPSHNLSVRYRFNFRIGCFTCGGKAAATTPDCLYYYCTTCEVTFHNGCHQRPRRITHPYHLQHPLTLFYRNPETRVISNIIPDACPGKIEDTSGPEKYEFVDIVPYKSDIIFNKCTWCAKDFKGDWFYRCLICSFCLDLSCAATLPLLTITNPKSHHHSLVFLPRPLLVPCDACGLVDGLEPSYACFQCNYMVHQNCIDLPRVIKITRHPHRLSHTPYCSSLTSSCQICYKEVDIKYGQYSCHLQDCFYVVHSKCATHENVWDGKELEWEIESDETEDISPFRNLGDGFIKHFCHKHRLKLKNHDGARDTEKQCRACIYPIVSHQFYHCKKCNYSLHEVCAGLSRKLDHALHNHTLILSPSPGKFCCSACSRESTGFSYICSNKGCQDFVLDVRCISVLEYFIHRSHEHPIFISTSYNSKDEILCKVCKKRCLGAHLQCTLCEFTMCYSCAIIPDEIHYKFDKHPLTLSCGESADNTYWCEVCEKQLDPKEWFYTCNKCCITIHLHCIFGSSVFMKPGSIFRDYYGKVQVFRNNSNTRQLCYMCHNRCTGLIFYEGYRRNATYYYNHSNRSTHRMIFCSLECEILGMRKRRLIRLPR